VFPNVAVAPFIEEATVDDEGYHDEVVSPLAKEDMEDFRTRGGVRSAL
jgi:hypothetical protein